jgi:hypothetical protein
MIKYALQCNQGHSFESWFDSSSAYDKLARRGFVECPACGSTQVEKQIMSPTVRLVAAQAPADKTSEQGSSGVSAGGGGGGAATQSATPMAVAAEPALPAEVPDLPVALLSEKAQELREMIRSFHAHVEANTDDVGSKFADEARKIHYGEAEERAIRGKASLEEAAELQAEGIGFIPLPALPDKHN